MVESDGRTPVDDSRIVRCLDAIIALLLVIAVALVLEHLVAVGRGAVVVALLAVAAGLLFWAGSFGTVQRVGPYTAP